MKKIGKICIAAVVLVLGACKPYTPLELTTGEMTVQEALGYKSDGPYMAVTAESKHYQRSTSSRFYDGMEYGANGNDDGILNPGETVIYQLLVANYGGSSALSVSAVILTDDEYVSDMTNAKGVIGHFNEYGVSSPDSTKTIFSKYIYDGKNLSFTVSPNAPPGHIIKFEIAFSDAYDHTWQDYFLLTVY